MVIKKSSSTMVHTTWKIEHHCHSLMQLILEPQWKQIVLLYNVFVFCLLLQVYYKVPLDFFFQQCELKLLFFLIISKLTEAILLTVFTHFWCFFIHFNFFWACTILLNITMNFVIFPFLHFHICGDERTEEAIFKLILIFLFGGGFEYGDFSPLFGSFEELLAMKCRIPFLRWVVNPGPMMSLSGCSRNFRVKSNRTE